MNRCGRPLKTVRIISHFRVHNDGGKLKREQVELKRERHIFLFREAHEAERTEALAGAVCVSVDAKREPKPYACTYNVSHGCMGLPDFAISDAAAWPHADRNNSQRRLNLYNGCYGVPKGEACQKARMSDTSRHVSTDWRMSSFWFQ